MNTNKNFFITTPIYYVNARPHLGHAYTSILADAACRYHRMQGQKSFMLTGSDEHGDKIVQAAEKQGITAQQLADNVSAEFKALLPVIGAEQQQFVRTSSEQHKAAVQAFLQKVYDNGDIYFGEYGGHYCYGCERFYTEKELEDGLCPQHQVQPTYISEKNYFFRMSKYQDWLKQHILDNPDFIRPERYRNEVLALLDSGALEDLCISRPKTRLEWGIELPFDANYVCYVWFDALVSYISGLDWPAGENFAKFWPNASHLIAKDILKPHAIFWPTMLKAADIPVYKHLNVHGYWLVRDTKMSKSIGNVVDPLQITKTYGVDVFRYFLMREMHLGSDASFSEDALIARQNSDLANDLGNLFSRVLSMNAKYFESKVPSPSANEEAEIALLELGQSAMQNYQSLMEAFRFSAALEALWEFVRALNRYVDKSAPWVLFKEGQNAKLGTVMYTLLESLRKIALHLWPIMPGTAEKMLEQLGQKLNPEATNLAAEATSFGSLQVGITLSASSNLFPRIEREKAVPAPKEPKAKKEKKEAAPKTTGAAGESVEGFIEFNDFAKIDLRVGRILSAEKHPDADKLLCFSVDLGEEAPRSIVSGIANFFKPEELIGRQVIVVANLPPRKLRGVMSQGMILTAESEGKLTLLSPGGDVCLGTKIY